MNGNSFEMEPSGDELLEPHDFIEDMESLVERVPEEMQEVAGSFEQIQNNLVRLAVEQEEEL